MRAPAERFSWRPFSHRFASKPQLFQGGVSRRGRFPACLSRRAARADTRAGGPRDRGAPLQGTVAREAALVGAQTKLLQAQKEYQEALKKSADGSTP
ncbi:MAG: hypothetical protein LLG93_06420 [Deltaproteobacteria bacterium]|nr:hypothetical protein [Deltaproteobacteria bacterium]